MTKTKRCTECNKRRLVKFFHKNKANHDGLQTRCVNCRCKYQTSYNHENRQAIAKKVASRRTVLGSKIVKHS